MDRAFHVAGIAFAAAAFAVGCGLSAAYAAVSCVLALAVAIFYGGFHRSPPWTYFILSAVCACTASFAVFDTNARENVTRYAGTLQRLRCMVLEREDSISYSSLTLRVEANGAPPGLERARIKLNVSGGTEAQVGDHVELSLRLNFSETDRRRMYSDGLDFYGTATGGISVVSRGKSLRGFFAGLRDGIRKNITRNLPGEEGEVLVAMLTGVKGGLSPELRYDYSRSGVAHLLAVSGLHLSVLVGLIDCVLCFLPVSRRGRGAIEIFAVLAVMAVTGFPYSIIRAGVMSIIWRAALLLGRDSDSLNSLGFAFVLILLVNPYAAYSIGLQLSYLATMGIAAFASPLTSMLCREIFGMSAFKLRESRPKLYAALSGFSTTVAAQLLTVPLLCWNFGQLSLVSPIVNILITPLVPIALGCGMLCGLAGFSPLLELPAKILGLVGGVAIQGINALAREWSKPRFASISVRGETVIIWLTAAIATVILLYLTKSPARLWRYGASVMSVSLMAVIFVQTAVAGATITVAAVTGGNSVAVILGADCVVIGAPESPYSARNFRMLLLDYGVEKISLLVVEREEQLYGDPVALLTDGFQVENRVPIDKTREFSAVLAGQITISAKGRKAEYVTVEAGNLRIVKEFSQRFLPADILINADNELIFAPGREYTVNSRYFGSSVIKLRALPVERGTNE